MGEPQQLGQPWMPAPRVHSGMGGCPHCLPFLDPPPRWEVEEHGRRRRRVPRLTEGVSQRYWPKQVIWMCLQEAGVQAKGSCPGAQGAPEQAAACHTALSTRSRDTLSEG